MDNKIKEIIDTKIKPFLARDGGSLEVVSYEGNVLKIKYKGSCCGCPHAAMGTLKYIEQVLKEEYNTDIQVKMA
ncbi:MAG: NifU family protein [Candidatus Omnitrophica bacterium]|nr:NifU family protein [Candidatus Omnitrophota bacterium]